MSKRNTEFCKECDEPYYALGWCSRHYGIFSEASKASIVKHKKINSQTYRLKQLGWTTERVMTFRYAQGGLCYLCGETDFSQGYNRNLAADHDHGKMIPRGLLCTPCNMKVVPLLENPDLLIAATKYLTMFQDRKR